MTEKERDCLVVLWTSGDREVAEKMVFMYTLNSKLRGWWKEVILIIWGPSSKLITEDIELQDHLERLKGAGIKLEACISCTDMYRISKKIADMGIDVKPMGQPFTDYLKKGFKVITL